MPGSLSQGDWEPHISSEDKKTPQRQFWGSLPAAEA